MPDHACDIKIDLRRNSRDFIGQDIDIDHFKVYFRKHEDKEEIEHLLINKWGIHPSKLFFMNVDICRSNLLVEIESVVK